MIELGCGCGLVGLCFAACGAHVLLTDLPEPLVRPFPPPVMTLMQLQFPGIAQVAHALAQAAYALEREHNL